MANQVPESLAHLVYLNSEFNILICLGNGCSKAVAPRGFIEYLRKFHKTEPNLRKELGEYIKANFPLSQNYDYSSI
jgi:hypothetical protein